MRGLLGYLGAAAALSLERSRRDRELRQSCKAVLKEANLPESIVVHVNDRIVRLLPQRAEEVVSTVPGIQGVIHKITLKASGNVRVTPDEIQRQIRDSLVKRAEQDTHGIAVVMDHSRVIPEAPSRRGPRTSEAEHVAWA